MPKKSTPKSRKAVGGPYRAVAMQVHFEEAPPNAQPDSTAVQGVTPDGTTISAALTFKQHDATAALAELEGVLDSLCTRSTPCKVYGAAIEE